MAERTRTLHVRIKDDEQRMLAAVAELEGLTASAWLRRKIIEAYRRHFGGDRSPVPKP